MEPTQANVRSIDALQRLRVALIRCHEELTMAISEADGTVDRAVAWVERDRVPHWRMRIQRLGEEVNDARSALFRKQTVTSSADSKPSVVDEKKALDRAKAALDDAERRSQRSRAWAAEMPRQQALYKGGTSMLAAMVERDLPMAIAALERMSLALERYHRDAVPDLRSMLEPSDVPVRPLPGMRRAGEGSAPGGAA